jgi:glycosyltransferase involved in cell wall biosynthesis
MEKIRVLTCEPHALRDPFLGTEHFVSLESSWVERFLSETGLQAIAKYYRSIRLGLRLFRHSPGYDAVLTSGAGDGLLFAFLQKFRGRKRAVHVMEDCLWYKSNVLKKWTVRFCLGSVDACVVWASVEVDRYAREFEVPRQKFHFVPFHHTLARYQFEVRNEGYLFSGGNGDRDYPTLLEAVRNLPAPCLIATTRQDVLDRKDLPSNVQARGVSHQEFRQLMASSKIVVVQMKGGLLHAGGQQTVLNAMLMRKAVILTDPEGGRDYIEDWKTGVLVPAGDAEKLRMALERLLASEEDCARMGDAAHSYAAKMTVEECNLRIWEIIHNIVCSRQDVSMPSS